jgi:thioredoxin:protein disulfide reductase
MLALAKVVLLLALGAQPALGHHSALHFGGSSPKLLEPEQAFRFSARPRAGAVEVQFAIADGYYMYRDKFRFAVEGNADVRLGAPELPPAIRHRDEFFGEVDTYRKAVTVRIPAQGSGTFDLKVESQGCADVGICYVPMESRTTLRLAAATATDAAAQSEAPRRLSIFASDFDIARLFEGNVLLVLASFAAFGLLLTFTPCVLPMVPILSGIIAGDKGGMNKLRALGLSLSYVLGMASAYAAAGVAAGYSGSMLAAALQNAWVLGAFALIFVGLALSMFGFYELRLPAAIEHRLHGAHQRLRGGRIASVAAMGAFSAVIVSPCVAAPLAGALLYISQTRDVVLGGAALFAMALGMGVPLIAVGVSEGALLPKAGAWMDAVRKFFGVLLLAVAVWIVSPVIPATAQMLAWAALLVGSAIFLRALDPLPDSASGWRRLGKTIGVLSLVAGISLVIGALSGSRDPLQPLSGLGGKPTPAVAPLPWARVASLDDLEGRLRDAGKPVMLDFYADWCISCKEMEAFTFSDPRVRSKLAGMLLLQADVTRNTAQDKALLKRFSLFGPPGIIFFDAKGREITGLRVIGYQDADRFLRMLESATSFSAGTAG